jgi:TonB family protein
MKTIRSTSVSEKSYSPFSLTLIISVFLHITFVSILALPDFGKFSSFDEIRSAHRGNSLTARDIIVNINQDDTRSITKRTLLSDRDSTARGKITDKRGDRWLNNSLVFRLPSGTRETGKTSQRGHSDNLLLTGESDISISIERGGNSGSSGEQGDTAEVKIPDKNDVTMENSIYYSNTGTFSFNTAKFKQFHYFRKMKDRIASNWFPPLMANSQLLGYAPGRTRIMAIQNQRVKLYFVMNRNGDVESVAVLDSMGNAVLDRSCVEAVQMSKTFGPVPEEITGEKIVIPFIFGYYSN